MDAGLVDQTTACAKHVRFTYRVQGIRAILPKTMQTTDRGPFAAKNLEIDTQVLHGVYLPDDIKADVRSRPAADIRVAEVGTAKNSLSQRRMRAMCQRTRHDSSTAAPEDASPDSGEAYGGDRRQATRWHSLYLHCALALLARRRTRKRQTHRRRTRQGRYRASARRRCLRRVHKTHHRLARCSRLSYATTGDWPQPRPCQHCPPAREEAPQQLSAQHPGPQGTQEPEDPPSSCAACGGTTAAARPSAAAVGGTTAVRPSAAVRAALVTAWWSPWVPTLPTTSSPGAR